MPLCEYNTVCVFTDWSNNTVIVIDKPTGILNIKIMYIHMAMVLRFYVVLNG